MASYQTNWGPTYWPSFPSTSCWSAHLINYPETWFEPHQVGEFRSALCTSITQVESNQCSTSLTWPRQTFTSSEPRQSCHFDESEQGWLCSCSQQFVFKRG